MDERLKGNTGEKGGGQSSGDRRSQPVEDLAGSASKTGRVSSVSEGGRGRAAGRIAAMSPRSPTGQQTLKH